MTGKVIQGSFLAGQPRWSPSVQPKIAPPSSQAKVVPPPTAFASRLPQSRPPAQAAHATALQRHGAGGAFAVEAGSVGLVSGGGKSLPDAVRSKMEAALGADFSGVRVHIGPQAERIGAIAFTVGSDIYFAPGRYQPDTIPGQQLLGHELAHVVQQCAGRVRNPLGSGLAVVHDRALEVEADRMGQRAAIHRVAMQAKMLPGTAQPSTPVRISPPVGAGRSGSYRLSAGAGGREIGSVMVHSREQGAVEVTDLHVSEAQRGRGIGQMLLASAARTGQQFGKSKVSLAAQDSGTGRLTQWYKRMGFTQIGMNQRGYPKFEAPISRVLGASAQRRAKQHAPPPPSCGFASGSSLIQRMDDMDTWNALHGAFSRGLGLTPERSITGPAPSQGSRPSRSPNAASLLLDAPNDVQTPTLTPTTNLVGPSLLSPVTNLVPKKDPFRKAIRSKLVQIAGEVKAKVKIANPMLADTAESQKMWAIAEKNRGDLRSHEGHMRHGEYILSLGWGACTDIAAATYYLLVTKAQEIFQAGYRMGVYWAGTKHAYVVVTAKTLPQNIQDIEDDAWVIDAWSFSVKDSKVQKVKGSKFNIKTSGMYNDGKLVF